MNPEKTSSPTFFGNIQPLKYARRYDLLYQWPNLHQTKDSDCWVLCIELEQLQSHKVTSGNNYRPGEPYAIFTCCLFWLTLSYFKAYFVIDILIDNIYLIEFLFLYFTSELWPNIFFLREQGSKEIEERSPEKEKRKAKVRGDERKERKMSRKRVSVHAMSSIPLRFLIRP